jgi:hypothetical protein
MGPERRSPGARTLVASRDREAMKYRREVSKVNKMVWTVLAVIGVIAVVIWIF